MKALPAPYEYHPQPDQARGLIMTGKGTPLAEVMHRGDAAHAAGRIMAAGPELLESLREVTRILEAVRYTVGFGKNQLERYERAKALIARHQNDL